MVGAAGFRVLDLGVPSPAVASPDSSHSRTPHLVVRDPSLRRTRSRFCTRNYDYFCESQSKSRDSNRKNVFGFFGSRFLGLLESFGYLLQHLGVFHSVILYIFYSVILGIFLQCISTV